MRPADQETRERIVSTRGSSLAVEAGAGTGKTTLLVARILSLLETGTPMSRLAVITFTKKAAGELAARIREKLARTDEAWARRAEEDLDLAVIGTTDSFCRGILADFPLEANVPPGFTIVDDVVRPALEEQAWKRFWENADPAASSLARRLREAGTSPAELRRVAEEVLSHRDLELAAPPPSSVPDLVESIAPALTEVLALRSECGKRDDKLLLHLNDLQRDWNVARAVGGAAAERVLLTRELRKNVGLKSAWGERGKKRVQDGLRRAQDVVEEFRRARGRALAAEVATALPAYLREYEKLKRDRGVLDFRDLALVTRDLLRDHPSVCRRVAARFDVLLMDEIQDTDPLQMEIAFRLAAVEPGASDPFEAPLVPGKLFLVGDPKQSIYRFRRADIELYQRARDRVAIEGESSSVSVNFRSRPEILSFVNTVFDGWMVRAPGTSHQADYVPLLASPVAPPEFSEPSAVRFLLPDARFEPGPDEKPLRRHEREARETDLVVRQVHDVLGTEGEAWEVRDLETGTPRAATPDDVAVLVRRIEWGDRLVEELRREGLPAASSGGGRLYGREEIHTVRALVESLADPTDRAARFSALRAPVFGLSDDDLVLHFLEEESRSSVIEADRALDALAGAAPGLPFPEFLERVIEELDVLPAFGFRADGAARVENVSALLDSLDTLVDSGIETLPGFVRWLREKSDGSPGSDLDATGRGVQVLTMHKSKGLEFPVVILADLGGGTADESTVIADRSTGRVEFRLSERSGVETPGYEEAAVAEKERRRAEEIRLLYVATTRARDHLVVSWPPGKRGFFASAMGLAERIGAEPGEEPPAGLGVRVDRGEALPERRAGGEVLSFDPATVRPMPPETGTPEPDPARGPRVFAVTSLLDAPDGEATGEPDVDPVNEWSGKEFGRWIHAALEGFAPGSGLEEIVSEAARKLVARENLSESSARDPDRLREVREYLSRVVEDPAVRPIWKAPRILREAPFLLPLGEDFLSGTLDVVVVGSQGALSIVDYKTDRGPLTARKEARFRSQGLLYAYALSRVAGAPVREVRFLLLSRNPVETLSVPIDEEALAEARAVLGRARMVEPIPPVAASQ